MLRKAAFASSVVASDADRLALDEVGRRQHLQDPREDRPVRFEVDQPPRRGDRRVLGCGLVEAQPEEAAQRQGIGGPPGDPALRIDALEVPDQQQSEIRPRRQARASHRSGVKRCAVGLDEVIEPVRVEDPIQALIKRVTASRRQLIRGQSTTRACVLGLCVDPWPCRSVVRRIDHVDPPCRL